MRINQNSRFCAIAVKNKQTKQPLTRINQNSLFYAIEVKNKQTKQQPCSRLNQRSRICAILLVGEKNNKNRAQE